MKRLIEKKRVKVKKRTGEWGIRGAKKERKVWKGGRKCLNTSDGEINTDESERRMIKASEQSVWF